MWCCRLSSESVGSLGYLGLAMAVPGPVLHPQTGTLARPAGKSSRGDSSGFRRIVHWSEHGPGFRWEGEGQGSRTSGFAYGFGGDFLGGGNRSWSGLFASDEGFFLDLGL